jgi:hypothetical protein
VAQASASSILFSKATTMTDVLAGAADAARIGDRQGRQEVLDFLVTGEQLGVTFVTAAIQNAPAPPSEAFLPVLRDAVTTEYHLRRSTEYRVRKAAIRIPYFRIPYFRIPYFRYRR